MSDQTRFDDPQWDPDQTALDDHDADGDREDA